MTPPLPCSLESQRSNDASESSPKERQRPLLPKIPVKRLGQLLLELGWISETDLQRALQAQSVLGGRLGTCLLEVDALNEQLLNQALAKQLGTDAVKPLDLQNVPRQILSVLDRKTAVRCRAVPYRLLGGELWVAMLDVKDLLAIDEITFACGHGIRPHVANEHRIEIALERYYQRQTTQRFRRLFDRLQEEDPTAVTLNPDLPQVTTRPLDLSGLDLGLDGTSFEVPDDEIEPMESLEGSARLELPPAASALGVTTRPSPAGDDPDVHEIEAAHATTRETNSFPALDPDCLPDSEEPVTTAPLAVAATLDEFLDKIVTAPGREQIAQQAVAYLGTRYRRVAMLLATPDGCFRGLAGSGTDLDLESLREWRTSPAEPSVFLNVKLGSDFFFGPLPPMDANIRLMACWNAPLAESCYALPVRVGERVVAVLFSDLNGRSTRANELEEQKTVADAVGRALAACIMRSKKREANVAS